MRRKVREGKVDLHIFKATCFFGTTGKRLYPTQEIASEYITPVIRT